MSQTSSTETPRKRGRPPKVRPAPGLEQGRVVDDATAARAESLAGVDALEAEDAAARDAAAAPREAARARCRAAYAPVPAVIVQLGVLKDLYWPELERLVRLPFQQYEWSFSNADKLIQPLRDKVFEVRGLLAGRAYPDYEVASIADQLRRCARQIETLTPQDEKLGVEILEACRVAEEWPATVHRLMTEIRDLHASFLTARRLRGGDRVVSLPAAGAGDTVTVTTPTGDPAPGRASDLPVAMAFDPLERS